MLGVIRTVLVSTSFVATAFAQERPLARTESAAANLPVKRVALYKNGVGYFEHLGSVQSSQSVEVRFTTSQLDDVLKSLTVLDLGGGRITGVNYGSVAPLDRRLGDLRIPVDEKTTLTEFLGNLRGARLEVRSGTTVVTGRLLSVERKTRMGGGATLEVDYLSFITENGEVKTAELSPAFSVRILDRDLTGRVGRYMDLLSSTRDADLRRMTIATAGSGERQLFVSYISEVPVWKSTYRIVLSSKPGQKPLLQGWAIVDNTVGEDWENVQLSLIAGAPQSFIQKISQPFYSRRPVVPLPETASMTPQTHQATLAHGSSALAGVVTDATGAAVAGASVKVLDPGGAVLASTTADADGRYQLEGLADGVVRLEIEAPGFSRTVLSSVAVGGGRQSVANVTLRIGSVTDTVTVNAQPGEIQTSSSMSGSRSTGTGRSLGNTGMSKRAPPVFGPGSGVAARPGVSSFTRTPPDTLAQELGDLFEYRIKEPITIQKNQSALVPIVQAPVEVEKVSVWSASDSGPRRPRRALWLNNSSGLTLDSGSFSVIEEEAFAGEGIFDAIRPGEKRLVSYALDLPLNASSKQATEYQRVTRVRVSRGVMIQQREMREKTTYTFRNEDMSQRTVIVEHPSRSGYELRGNSKPEEIAAGSMRFRLPVPSKQTVSLAIEEARPTSASFTIAKIGTDQIGAFVSEKSITPAIEQALRASVAARDAMAALKTQSETRETERDRIYDDQQRLRENMKALRGSTEEKALLQRYTQQLNQQEDRLQALEKEIGELETRIEKAEQEIQKMIDAFVFDVIV